MAGLRDVHTIAYARAFVCSNWQGLDMDTFTYSARGKQHLSRLSDAQDSLLLVGNRTGMHNTKIQMISKWNEDYDLVQSTYHCRYIFVQLLLLPNLPLQVY